MIYSIKTFFQGRDVYPLVSVKDGKVNVIQVVGGMKLIKTLFIYENDCFGTTHNSLCTTCYRFKNRRSLRTSFFLHRASDLTDPI